MEAFLSSLGLVAVAEMGDKTQLLALFLAARFGRPIPICLGILAATVANHLLAGLVGITVADLLPMVWAKWGIGLSFCAMGAWSLIPDRLDEDAPAAPARRGVFLTTLITFFLVEMGDKTQLATVGLAARFHDLVLVAAGTTLGMLLADVPVVFLGERLTRRIPAATLRKVAAALFLAFGLAVLWGW